MNTKLIATIIVTSVASYLLLTEIRGHHMIQKRIDFNNDGLIVDEKSGFYTVSRSNEIFPSRNGGELRFEIGQNENGTIFIKFVIPNAWDEQLRSDKASKSFRDAIFRYFYDITERLSSNGTLALIKIRLDPFVKSNETLTHVLLGIQCNNDPKLQVTRLLQCQLAAANVAKQINVNELIFYVHAYAAEVVGVGGNGERKSSEASNFIHKSNNKYFKFLVDTSASDYEETDSDVIVTRVQPLGGNFYRLHADILEKFEVDELFKCAFKNYTAENFEFNTFFSNQSKIAIDNITENPPFLSNETHVSFDLVVFNIDILESDLRLERYITVFDEIFRLFDVNEFRGKLYSIEECQSLIKKSMTNDTTAAPTADNTATADTTVSDTTHFNGINDDSATHSIESDSDVNKTEELTEGSCCDLLFSPHCDVVPIYRELILPAKINFSLTFQTVPVTRWKLKSVSEV